MPSITYWSQLRPTPRTTSLADSLAARLRDPAWLLARQWQLGEFRGGDCGSPAFVQIASHTAPFVSATVGISDVALAPAQSPDALIGREPLTPDLPTRVEIGQTFEALLARAQLPSLVRDAFRTAYPLGAANASTPPDIARFLGVVGGRSIDGVTLYTEVKTARQGGSDLPPQPSLPATLQPPVAAALTSFITWVEATWGALGSGTPAAWQPERLEYRLEMTARTDNAAELTLAGASDPEADLDWYAFDLDRTAGDSASTPVATTSVVPGHVRFRGMPNARWWDFETAQTDFGAILTDTRDLGKLLFMDFMLIHGDDWYIASLDVPAGSLSFVDSLVVTDVFGVTTSIPRADATGPAVRWNLFGTFDRRSGGLAPFLVVPAQAPALHSAPLEEVHLLRDETANMAWAIEHTVEGPLGVVRVTPTLPAEAPIDAPAPLAYQLATAVPENWYPLLPVPTAGGAIALVLGRVEGAALAPAGRFVQRIGAPDFQLPEEEVPRGGVKLTRVLCRARSADGAAHLWTARRKRYGIGEAASRLRYDVVRGDG